MDTGRQRIDRAGRAALHRQRRVARILRGSISAPLLVALVASSWVLAAPATAAGPATTLTLQLTRTTITANGVDQTTATATVKDAGNQPVSGETAVAIRSSDGADTVSTVTDNGDGTYTATITSTHAGTSTITASDTGVAPDSTSLTKTPGPAAHISVGVAPGSIIANGTDTSTATATVTDAHNNPVPGDRNVTIGSNDGGDTVSTVADHGNGTYTATITSTHVGTSTITASDTGVARASTSLTKKPFISTTTVTPTPSSAVTNQVVTLIAIVTASGGSHAPQGVMTFLDNGVAISGCINLPVAVDQQLISQSTCQTVLGASTTPRRLTAVFTSSSADLAGSSGSASIAVRQSSTATSLGISNATPTARSSTTFTATITPGQSGPITPGGSVTFLDGGQAIQGCTAQRVSQVSGQSSATCTITYQRPGSHSISARDNGDANFAGSAAPPQTVTVRKAPVKILGTIRAAMQWTFFFTPSYTSVRQFVVGGVPIGAAVSVACRGKGCPRASIVRTVKACKPKPGQRCHGSRATAVDLLAALRHRRFKPGTQIVVKITRPNWIGKYYRFTIRAARPPAIVIDCLAPGGANPGVGC